jgi:prolipoprotein diacylglyceryltransferase
MPYVWWLDRIMIPVALGGALVRLGNLFNSEIVGCATDMPWGFKFVRLYPNLPVESIPAQHPAQLYEAICYLITFAILLWMYFKRDEGRKRPGFMFGIGLVGIFLTRPFIELIKENQEAFEEGMAMNMGQLLSIPFIIMAVYMIWGSLKGRFPVAQPPKQTKRNKR